MKILFSPSEGKVKGGNNIPFDKNSFLFPELYAQRKEVLDKYKSFINNATQSDLSKIFGIKDSSKFTSYTEDIYSMGTMKVIERYSGVAFDYLDYASLDKEAQDYIDNNTIIFSNLFGPIAAGDKYLPEYKLKQGEKIDGFAPEQFYKKHFSQALDDVLNQEVYLDLRAGFYNKFYKQTSPYVTLKFLKNDKVVSHWAKAYRGLVLKSLAINNIKNIDQFMKINIEGLVVREILEKGVHTEIVYNITL